MQGAVAGRDPGHARPHPTEGDQREQAQIVDRRRARGVGVGPAPQELAGDRALVLLGGVVERGEVVGAIVVAVYGCGEKYRVLTVSVAITKMHGFRRIHP